MNIYLEDPAIRQAKAERALEASIETRSHPGHCHCLGAKPELGEEFCICEMEKRGLLLNELKRGKTFKTESQVETLRRASRGTR